MRCRGVRCEGEVERCEGWGTRLVGRFAASSDGCPLGEEVADAGADAVGVSAGHGLSLRRSE